MRAEFYVTQVVLWNPSLREKVGAIIGLKAWEAKDPEQVLHNLRRPQTLQDLARWLECDEANVFAAIKDHLLAPARADKKGRASGGAGFAETIADPRFISIIADFLDCSSNASEVCDRLFRVEEIREFLLKEKALLDPGQVDAAAAVVAAFRPEMLRNAMDAIYATDPGEVLLHWLREDEMNLLCNRLNCEPEQIPGRLHRLAGAYQEAVTPRKVVLFGDNTDDLDLFAVEKFREFFRIHGTASMRQAREDAISLLNATDLPRGARLLAALIDFWGQGAFRSAFRVMPDAQWTIQELASEIHVVDTILVRPGMEIRCSESSVRRDTLVIEYRHNATEEWHSLLTLQITLPGAIELIRRSLPQFSEQIDSEGDQLAQRVATLRLRAASDAEARVWRAAIESDSAFTDFAVSSGMRIADHWEIEELFQDDSSLDLMPLKYTRLCTMTPEQLFQSAERQLGYGKDPLVV